MTCWNDSHLTGNKAVINSNESVGGNMLKAYYKHHSFTHSYEATQHAGFCNQFTGNGREELGQDVLSGNVPLSR